MFNVKYFLSNNAFVNQLGLQDNDKPFIFSLSLKVDYANVVPRKQVLDNSKKRVVALNEPDFDFDPFSGYDEFYTENGLLVISNENDNGEVDYSFEIEDFSVRYENGDFPLADTDGYNIWIASSDKDLDGEFYKTKIKCYSASNIGCVWEFIYNSYNPFGSHSHTPKKVGNCLVINLGYASKKSGSYVPEMAEAYERLGFKDDIVFIDGGLLAIDIETGKEIWRAKYDYAVSNFIAVEDRLFLAYLGEVIELDVNSGREINRVDTGYEHAHAFADQGAIHDVGEYLAYVSTLDKGITVYDKSTLHEVQKIQIPELYSLKSFNSFYVGEENKVYATLKGDAQSLSRPSDYLLMVLTPCQQGDLPSIDIEQKPPRTVTVIEEDAEEFYRVELDAETADQLIRFAEVEIDLIAGNHGRTMWGAPAQNKKFAGRIEFQATLPEELPNSEIERAKEYLIVLREYWDKVKEDDCYGPYGGKPGTYICPNFYLNGETI